MMLIHPGKNAFEQAIKHILHATSSIEIQMFIWRDDVIGNQLLDALIVAAQKGIHIHIKKDLFGSIFEKSEENKQSMFHKTKHLYTSIYAFMIDHMYQDSRKPKGYKQNPNPKVAVLKTYPNVKIETTMLKDHTKYYIFDEEILLIGGVNVEDKEFDKDIQGRRYKDYMVLIENREIVAHFKARLNGLAYNPSLKIEFITNHHDKEAKKILPTRISGANQQIIMHMAYFGAKKANKAILAALKKGIKMDILTSEISNLQNDYNRKLLKKFYQAGATIYLYPGLVHAKALLIDDQVIVGSVNLNRAAFDKLGECSIMIVDTNMKQSFLDAHDTLKQASHLVSSLKDLTYKPLTAFFESLVS
ncbi:MAG: hypothetical protein CVV63_01755 [Tenericutes bacterium HGW-Tenericutes-8]|nr:MAG: hypothetical protein CVV63_01755 [Tenericutes bacterium HGW-Tenericutes-8]